MANPEHVEIVKQGADAIDEWRAANPDERLELLEADLEGAELNLTNLQGANLQGANLQNANLISLNLQGAKLSSAILQGARLTMANLQGANLKDANLKVTVLQGANLKDANLQSAKLYRADLQSAKLQHADLQGVQLVEAKLQGTDFYKANLQDANLQGANLKNSNLNGADLTRANFNQNTNFYNVSVNTETKGIGPWIFNPEKYIIREIEFPPEYRQAGIGVMNYFAEVIRQKYPDISATVQITQEGTLVRMTIETDDGHREVVEKTLEEYGLVVAGKMTPDELLTGEVEVLGLQNRLEIAQMELRLTRNQLQLAEQQNRRLEIRTATLEDDVHRLQDVIIDAFKRQLPTPPVDSSEKLKPVKHFRIFISSPGDVAEERHIARHVIESVLPQRLALRGKASFEVVAWDHPDGDVPLAAGLTPQEAINRGLPKPSECDVTLVILWGRMGSPLPDEYQKDNGERYLSGTEWEFEDARQADPASVFIYRRVSPPLPQRGDAEELQQMAEQAKQLEGFLSQFRNEDGSYAGSVNTYETPEDFKEKLTRHLEMIVAAR